MAQHDYVIANGTGAAVRSDLNNALSAIVSQNSGATEPATMYAYQWWADTTTGLLKIRNAANNAWVTVGTLASANLGLLSSGGTITAALGSASTPGITFTGDINTGIYSPGADQVAISTNGTGRLFVDSSGNVTINGQGDLRFADSDSSNWVAFQAPATVASNVTWTLPSADGSASQVLSTDGSGTLSWASPSSTQISQGNTSAAVIDTGSDGRFVVTTEGSERARIDSSGRLLVGTSTARSNLYNDAAGIATNVQLESALNSYANGLSIVNNSASGFPPCLFFGQAASTSIGSNTLTGDGTPLGRITFGGADGTNLIPAARIQCFVDGTPGANDMPGRLVFSTTADGTSSPTERMRITNDGYLWVGSTAGGAVHRLQNGAADGTDSFVLNGANEIARFRGVTSAANPSSAASALWIRQCGSTNRSINASGTINASGADYAEYMTKAGDFIIAKGDICGVDADGLLTILFSEAVSFVVKSTKPSYVGGDNWGIGYDDDPEGLESERQKVDRIAFAGQVPVNVMGATPGQYIVPVEAADGCIEGIAKDEADLTLAEYMRSVGKVIAIEDDGRARIIVKVA